MDGARGAGVSSAGGHGGQGEILYYIYLYTSLSLRLV